MRPTDDVASAVGRQLGGSSLLLRRLPSRQGSRRPRAAMKSLRLVLGDQLSFANPALEGIEDADDSILMIEASSESTAVWSNKPRIAIFLSAMRHFALEVAERRLPLIYVRVDDPLPGGFAERLEAALAAHRCASPCARASTRRSRARAPTSSSASPPPRPARPSPPGPATARR